MNNKYIQIAPLMVAATIIIMTTPLVLAGQSARADPTATVESCYGVISIRCAAHDLVNGLKEAARGATDSIMEPGK